MGIVLNYYLNGNEDTGTYVLNDQPELWAYKKVAIEFRNMCRKSEELQKRINKEREEQ